MKAKTLAASQFAIFSLTFITIIPIPIPAGLIGALVYLLSKRIWKIMVFLETLIETRSTFNAYQGAQTLMWQVQTAKIPVYVQFFFSIYGYMIVSSLSFLATNYIAVRLINWYFRRKIPQLRAIVK